MSKVILLAICESSHNQNQDILTQVLALFTTPATSFSSLMFHFIQRNNDKKVLVSGAMHLGCVGVGVNMLQMSVVLSA